MNPVVAATRRDDISPRRADQHIQLGGAHDRGRDSKAGHCHHRRHPERRLRAHRNEAQTSRQTHDGPDSRPCRPHDVLRWAARHASPQHLITIGSTRRLVIPRARDRVAPPLAAVSKCAPFRPDAGGRSGTSRRRQTVHFVAVRPSSKLSRSGCAHSRQELGLPPRNSGAAGRTVRPGGLRPVEGWRTADGARVSIGTSTVANVRCSPVGSVRTSSSFYVGIRCRLRRHDERRAHAHQVRASSPSAAC
jgi:hypothetical protein